MYITKVQLENIKSHAEATFEFQPGTIAITGENGAGKTTVIEAIAWVLFDLLEYNKDDFIMRGRKKGKARVSFYSNQDQANYTVVRDTGTGYFVVNEAGVKVVEKKADVLAFLREHLRIEPGTDLKSLFRSAIGVPQGTFTAIFLETPQIRKDAFDRLLKVEEYKQGAEKLRATGKLIDEKLNEVRRKISRAEGELARFEQVEKENAETQAQIDELSATLAELRQNIEAKTEFVKQFDAAQARVEETRTKHDQLNFAHQKKVQEEAVKQAEHETSVKAAAKIKEVEPQHLQYLAALETLTALEVKRTERDRLKSELNQVENSLISVKAENKSLAAELQRAINASRQIGELEPQIRQQEQLEAEYKQFLERRAEVFSADKRAKELEIEVNKKREEYRELNKKIEDAQHGQDAEERLPAVEAEIKKAEIELKEAEKAATSLSLLRPQLKKLEEEIKEMQVALQQRERELKYLEKFSVSAAEVSKLSTKEEHLTMRIAQIRAKIETDEKFHREVKNGLCPILSQRCLNLKEGETLENYFKAQSVESLISLEKLTDERTEISRKLQTARESEKKVAKIEDLSEQTIKDSNVLTQKKIAFSTLKGKIDGFSSFTPEIVKAKRANKEKLELERKKLHEAAKKFAEVKAWQATLENIKKEGLELSEQQKTHAAVAADLERISEQIAENDRQLDALGNPKARVAALRQEAVQVEDFQKQIAITERILKQFEGERNKLNEDLAKFLALDEKLKQAQTERDATLAAHREFLINEPLAAKLSEIETDLEQIKQEVSQVREELKTAEEDFETANKNYDGEKHQVERITLTDLTGREAATAATLTSAESRQAKLTEELEHLAKVREEMQTELQESERLKKLGETTEFIRDTLKKAAAPVAKFLRYAIAHEATQIFREVNGDITRSLKWDDNYEVILEEGGHERPFFNLSGGEQMAAALSIRLALLRQLSDVRVAFFDEPTTNLDKERRENLAQQIGEISNFDQLFIISHDDTFDEYVDQVVFVEKGKTES